MPFGLTDPLTAVAFSAMPIEDLSRHHRDLVCAGREAEHWHRLIAARIDLAVAAIADLDEPQCLGAVALGTVCTPPSGLRDLLGIPGSGRVPPEFSGDSRLSETRLLPQLRQALAELDAYARVLDMVTDEAARVLAHRVGTVRLSA